MCDNPMSVVPLFFYIGHNESLRKNPIFSRFCIYFIVFCLQISPRPSGCIYLILCRMVLIGCSHRPARTFVQASNGYISARTWASRYVKAKVKALAFHFLFLICKVRALLLT